MTDREEFTQARNAGLTKRHQHRLAVKGAQALADAADRAGAFRPRLHRPATPDPDPLTAARKIAKVLLGLLEPETAAMLASKAAEQGEPWLYDHWRDWLADVGRESHAEIYAFTPRKYRETTP